MEFVGNRVNFKTVSITIIIAFCIGRGTLFGGIFPASIGLITVMIAVSTVYIYLVPILIAAMMTNAGMGMQNYGDMWTIIICGFLFLFLHNSRLTINQRTAIAAAVAVVCNCLYYVLTKTPYLFHVEDMTKEIIGIIIYIRVFNTVAKNIFCPLGNKGIPFEKSRLAYLVFLATIIGSLNNSTLSLPLWMFAAAVLQTCKNFESGAILMVLGQIYFYCTGEDHSTGVVLCILAGMFAAEYISSLIDKRYKKTIVALFAFLSVFSLGTEHVYGATVAMAVAAAIPWTWMCRWYGKAKNFLLPNAKETIDIKMDNMAEILKMKKDIFIDLGKLYGGTLDRRQIVSYQFQGMAKVVEGLLQDVRATAFTAESLKNGKDRNETRLSITTGSASYAFDKISGDSNIAFNFDSDKVGLIISDGMGKGKVASTESQLVVTTLAKLLAAGFDVELAMKTINGILLSGNNDEMFATVDMAIINKKTGRTKIFKMGAASTFVKHKGKVAMIKKPALPMGITSGVKLEYLDVKLTKGDLLVMVSDGITDCDRKDVDCQWLINRLEEIQSKDADTVSELVVNKSAEKYQLRERDDLTVLVAAIG